MSTMTRPQFNRSDDWKSVRMPDGTLRLKKQPTFQGEKDVCVRVDQLAMEPVVVVERDDETIVIPLDLVRQLVEVR